MFDQIRQTLTKDEAQFVALLREAKTDLVQDAAELLAEAKAALAPLYTAAQQVMNSTNPAPASTAPTTAKP